MAETPGQKRARVKYQTIHKDRLLAAARKRYKADPQKHRSAAKRWRDRNPSKVAEQNKRWSTLNRERRCAINCKSDKKRRVKVNAYRRRNYRINHSRIRAYFKDYLPGHRARLRETSPIFVLVERMRSRIRAVLAKVPVRKSARTFDLIGCSPAELRALIESLFLPGMSWANRALWHVDHKRPLAAFDLTDPSQQRLAFHFSNLQPLWAHDNLSKSDRI